LARGSGRTQGVVLEGVIASADADSFATFTGHANDVLYLDPANCVLPGAIQIKSPGGKTVGGGFIDRNCNVRLDLPEDGEYRVDFNPVKSNSGRYRAPFVAVPPDVIAVAKDGTILRGNIAQRAAHHVYTFTGQAGAHLVLGGEGCQSDYDVTVIYGESDTVSAGPGCRFGEVELPKNGTYRVVINPYNSGAGSYAIQFRLRPGKSTGV
jgi:hypothetical protein